MEKKPLVLFFITGQSRSNSLDNGCLVTKSWSEYVFTQRLHDNFEYKVYIDTDEIEVKKYVEYIGEKNIGNIYSSDNAKYYKTHNIGIKKISWFVENNPNNFRRAAIYQHYRLLRTVDMATIDITKSTFICRLRMDTPIVTDIEGILRNFKGDLVIHWDWAAIGRAHIMKEYCTSLVSRVFRQKLRTINLFKRTKRPPMLNTHPVWSRAMYEGILFKSVWLTTPELLLFETITEFSMEYNIKVSCQVICSLNRNAVVLPFSAFFGMFCIILLITYYVIAWKRTNGWSTSNN